MRINELLTESEMQYLEEGPKLDAFGRGVGKVVGGVAKGVGAVAGGAVGAYNALKKGFQTGKAVVGDDPDPNAGAPGYTAPVEPAARTANTGAADAAPQQAMNAPTSSTTPPSAADINAQGPQGSAPAKAQTGDAGRALAKSTAVVDKQQAQNQEKANQTVYAQVKANVDKLDKKGKQRILQMLQKSMSMPAPAEPKAGAGAGAIGNMAKQLAGEKPNTMANAPVSKTNVAKPGNPNAATPAATPKKNLGFGFNTDTGEPFSSAEERTAAGDAGTDAASLFPTAAPTATKARGGKVAGQVSQTPGAIAKRGKRQAAAAASSAGNKVMGNMVNTLQQQNASRDNYGNALSEALARQIDVHKQKMFETGLSKGSISVFRK